jgi:hypothetical protein
MDGQDELSRHFDAVRARRCGLPSVYQLSRNRNYAVAKFLPPPYKTRINAEPNGQFSLPFVTYVIFATQNGVVPPLPPRLGTIIARKTKTRCSS